MKTLVSIFVLIFSVQVYAQKDSVNRDRTFEGLHMKTLCLVDTSLIFHQSKKFVVKDSSTMTYDFVAGDQTYIEVRLRSTVCKCIDCSFSHHVIVNVTGVKTAKSVSLSAKNTVWISWNSMMIPSTESSFSGTLKLVDSGLLLMEISKFIPSNPSIVYDGIKVRKKLS